MPKYFFSANNVLDHIGEELPNDEAAWLETSQMASASSVIRAISVTILFASFPSVAGEKKGFMYMNKGALLWSIVAHRNMHQLDRQSLLLMITLRL
jgi:hypothetical protein